VKSSAPCPAGIRLKAFVVLLRQTSQRAADADIAECFGIAHWPAQIRREAGTVHHAGIDAIEVGHHAFTQAGYGFVHHAQNQALGNRLVCRGTLAAIHRPALLVVGVKTLAALLAQMPGRDLVAQTLRHAIPSGPASSSATDRQMSRPDRVGQQNRAHGHAEVDGGTSMFGERLAFFREHHRLDEIRHEHAG